MGMLNKFFFWFFVIVLAFMPFGIIMSFALLILYYGIPMIKSELRDICNDLSGYHTEIKDESISQNEYSDDTLEKMR